MSPHPHTTPVPVYEDRRKHNKSTLERNDGHGHATHSVWWMTLCALGVVFGDIGTSPLYALKECLDPEHGIALNAPNILGILSLIFWSLMSVVSFKYTLFILRADHHGEGGTTALLAKLTPAAKSAVIPIIALFGAGLLYGDGIITPAISVLSAIEGLKVPFPAMDQWVMPLTLGILILLFSVQHRGSGKIGSIFGPVTLTWFLAIAAIGIPWIIKEPSVLWAILPTHAIRFLTEHGMVGFWILGSVVLVVTGAEALYADMGHFGRTPIRRGWLLVVFPCLILNYFGQGALMIQQGEAALVNPFYSLVDGWLIYPLIAIATLATIIASQALITGAFSLTQQAIQLGYLPRMNLLHTSRSKEGQIYIPAVNSFLAISCCLLVFTMKSSDKLADAYGMAVTGTMLTTTILFYFVAKRIWKWSTGLALLVTTVFLVIDIAFLSTSLAKFAHGGWIPLLIAILVFATMTTWKRGRNALASQMQSQSTPLSNFLKTLSEEKNACARVPGTAVFMTLNRDVAPSVLLQHYKHNHCLHQRVVLLSIIVEHVPDVRSIERVRVTDMEQGFVKVIAKYGYMENPNIEEILQRSEGCGLQLNLSETSFYLGRDSFIDTGWSGMAGWRKRLFIFLYKNARSASEFFNLPSNRVIEIGSQIEI